MVICMLAVPRAVEVKELIWDGATRPTAAKTFGDWTPLVAKAHTVMARACGGNESAFNTTMLPNLVRDEMREMR